MTDARDGIPMAVFEADVAPFCALAIKGGAGQVAVGAIDGAIALQSAKTGKVVARMTMGTQTR